MKDHNVLMVSLPRTGTTSFCRMTDILGYTSYTPALNKIQKLFYGRTGMSFSDTPCFAPSVYNEFLNSGQKTLFVYIDRDFDSWFDSMTKSTNLLRTQYNLMRLEDEKIKKPELFIDRKYYYEVFGDFDYYSKEFKQIIRQRFFEHRRRCFEDLKNHLLIYKFSQGWKPLCDFLQVNIPNEEIPHLHNMSMRVK
jgi:hypothetical protein